MQAWWFSNKAGQLGYGDYRWAKVGRTHKVKCEPILCEQGLHASARLINALRYASSSILWKVELGGIIVKGKNKASATERTYIKRIDVNDILFKFSCLCALDVIHLWDAPPVVIEFLKTGDPSIISRAARAAWAADAASDAASDAAWAASAAWAAWAADAASAAASDAWAADAASDAASDAWAASAAASDASAADAASDAARAAWAADAASDAASDAAWAASAADAASAAWAASAASAAWAADAASDAASDAIRSKQNKRLTQMVNYALKKAA